MHFEIPTGKLYLSPILGCFDSAIVSRTSSRTANSMLRVAILTTTEKQRSHPMIHSDCSCH
jgi:putative transposase